MPTTPNHALPYPAGTDPVSDGATNFQNLATAVDPALLPKGGTPDYALFKNGTADYAAQWRGPVVTIPAGGAAGQVLGKQASTDYQVGWLTVKGVPAGGVAGAHLVKNSGTDYDMVWTPAAGGYVPAGGSAGQVLAKSSATDFDSTWVTPTSGGGNGGPAARVVAATIAALNASFGGAPPDGALGMIATGAAALAVTYSAPLLKWIGETVYIHSDLGGSNLSTSGAYGTACAGTVRMLSLPNYAALWGAGLRPQFAVTGGIGSNVTGQAAFLRGMVAEFNEGDAITVANSVLGGGAEITDAVIGNARMHTQSWSDPSPAMIAPTKAMQLLGYQGRIAGGGGISGWTTSPQTVALRWVG
jgi:hypothetical protein